MSVEPVIDCEVHLLHPEATQASFAHGDPEPVRQAIHLHPDFPSIRALLNLDALLASMESNNIEKCFLLGMSWLDEGRLQANNQYIEDVVSRYPKKFVGFHIPHLGNPLKAAQEIENLDTNIIRGIKILPRWQKRCIDDPELTPLWEVARKKDLFVMVHTDQVTQSYNEDTPQQTFRFIKKNPQLKILAPHLGGLLCLYTKLPENEQILSNTYFITSLSKTMELAKFAAETCPSRILFGSDFPFNHCHNQSSQLQELHSFNLHPEVLRGILRGNATRLLESQTTSHRQEG